nr:PAS domain S-box protein [uncultured Lacibacter sp.]
MQSAPNNHSLPAATFHTSFVGLALVDADGYLLQANDKFCTIFGGTQEQFLQTNFYRLFAEAAQDVVKTSLQKLWQKEKTSVEIETEGVKTDGSKIDLSVHADLFTAETKQQFIIVAISDISVQKIHEQQKEYDRLDKEALINSTADLIWSVNKEYKLLAANKPFARSLRRSDNLYLKPGDSVLVKDVFDDDLIHFWKNLYDRGLRGETFSIELHTSAVNEEAQERWDAISFTPIVSDEGVIGVACHGRDITQTKAYERELLGLNDQLETAQQIAKLGYWSHNLKTDELFWSKEVYEIYAVSKEDFEGNFNSFYHFVHPDDRERFEKEKELALAGSAPLYHEHRIVTPSNEVKYVIQKGTVLFDEEKTPIAAQGTVQDITGLKTAEEALRLNEEQLNLIYNSTNAIIFLLGVEDGGKNFRFISMNNTGLSTIGLSKQQLFNQLVKDVIPEPSCTLVHEKYRQAVNKKQTIVWEEETTYPNGTKFGIVTVTPVFNTEGECIRLVGSVNDITDLKKAQRSLAFSRQEYKSLFDQNPDAVFSLDLEGFFTSFNPGLEKLLECTREEILEAATFVPFCFPGELETVMNYFQQAKNGTALTYQARAITKAGKIKHITISNMPILVDGVITGVYGIAKDISNEQHVLAQLELINERYEYATKATNDVIWDWNLHTGKVVRAGSGFFTMFGYDVKEADTDDEFWIKKVHHDDVNRIVTNRQKVLDNPQLDFWEDEYRFHRKNGEFAYVYDRGYIFRNEDGEPVRMIGATKDITEKKLAELQLKDLYQKLEERANQLQVSNTELERFAYIASHDLQEPLRMVSSFLLLLEKKYADVVDEKGKEYIRFAVDGSLRMKRLINDLLDYSRVTTHKQKLEPVQMKQVVSEVLQNLSLQIHEKQAVIKTELLPVLPLADKTQMLQLMQNLVGNALKYSGGQPPFIRITAKEQEEDWLFCVQDNGIGFDEQFAERIFVIFQRLHNRTQYSGTGIGLAICKKIVDRHGGKIYAESAEGQGSAFYFTIKKQLAV